MLNADCSFYIGKTHHVCEDYAFANVDSARETAIAIVSDGCSGSKHTDFGARFLVRSAYDRLTSDDQSFDELRVIHNAASMTKQVGLDDEALDATLLCLQTRGGLCTARIYGDGVIAAVDCSGVMYVYKYEYPSGMPFYLSYHLDRNRLLRYLAASGNAECIRTSYEAACQNRVETTESYFTYPSKVIQTLGYSVTFQASLFRLIAIMSDGVGSFYRREEASSKLFPVDLLHVVGQLVAMNNPNGVFIKRRCNRFLNSFCREHKWQHEDDLAVAAIHFGKP